MIEQMITKAKGEHQGIFALPQTQGLNIAQSVKERVEELNKELPPPQSKIDPSQSAKEEEVLVTSLVTSTVEELNRTLAIIHTTTTYILVEKSETEFVLDSKASLMTLYENDVVEIGGKKLSKAQIWLKSPNRRTFKNIVFNPRIVGHYDGNFNIWRGFAVCSVKGDCSLFWDHVKTVICGNRESHYSYVRKWLAHLIQKPWIIATALVIRGKQGTGKGTFVEVIGKLLGSHYAPLASLDKILGKFNSHLKNAILIFADEAIWGGNKKEVGMLKALITEPRFFIEGKGKDGYWIDNFKHLIVSSNEDWVVHIDPDDRRFFVLDISSDRKEDIPYFNAIRSQLEEGGYEALMYDLSNEDLTSFDPKVMPENFAGFDMKMESASSIDRYLYVSLKEGCWNHANCGPSKELTDLTKDAFYGHYKTWCEQEHQDIHRKENLGRRLKQIIPSLKTKRPSAEENKSRPCHYVFPSLENCRVAFEKFYKQGSQIWEES